jgi:hypothetical protein
MLTNDTIFHRIGCGAWVTGSGPSSAVLSQELWELRPEEDIARYSLLWQKCWRWKKSGSSVTFYDDFCMCIADFWDQKRSNDQIAKTLQTIFQTQICKSTNLQGYQLNQPGLVRFPDQSQALSK